MKLLKTKWPDHFMMKGAVALLFLLFSNFTVRSQEITVTGNVTSSANNESLPGVNILIKGTMAGTVTDFAGNYKITIPSGDTTLVFSYLGHLTQEVPVSNRTQINVLLEEHTEALDEVVFIGYGMQRKSDLTGSVATVSADELQKIPVTRFETALQGKAAGVQVMQNSGAPGANISVRVRGISTLTQIDGVSQGEPLWIVDGVPTSPDLVNIGDVESIEVLKDASAAAIYGSTGGSGVVLVTTKKGRSGKPVANLKYEHSIQSLHKKVDVASAPEMGAMYTEMQTLQGLTTYTFPDYNSLETYDYQDMIFKNAAMDNLDFNVSGGNENITTYMGIGYVTQNGILKNTSFKKLNIRLNSDYQPVKWLKIGENLSFTRFKNFGFEEWQYNNEYESPLVNAIAIMPFFPPYDSTGNWTNSPIGQMDPPQVRIDLLHKEFRVTKGRGIFYVNIEPLKGLTLESRITGGMEFKDNYIFNQTYNYGSGAGQNNDIPDITRRMEQISNYLWQNILSYNFTLMNSFNIGMMAGYEVGEDFYMDMRGYRRYLISENEENWYFDASSDDTTATSQVAHGGANHSAKYSYVGRLNLNYKGKYLFQSNFRRDVSSKFGPRNRVGNFPSFSLGWKFSEESFIKNNMSFLSFGKFRYGWGKTGNDVIRNYAYYSTVRYLSHFNYSMTGEGSYPGAAPDLLPNESVHWEDVVSENYAVDLAFLNNRLSLTVERFERHNIGMLISTTIPGVVGWTIRDPSQESNNVDPRPIENLGKITNKGWEFMTGWKDHVGKFNYELSVNYTYLKNLASELGADSVRSEGTARSIAGTICRTEEGEELGNFYGYQVVGIFREEDLGIKPNGEPGITNQPYHLNADSEIVYAQTQAMPGDFQFMDANNDGYINEQDRVILGNPFPKHTLGINMNFEYKIFSLSLFWYGAFGNKIFNAMRLYQYNSNGNFNWSEEYVNDHYRSEEIVARDADDNIVAVFPANTDSKNPRFDPFNNNGNFSRASSFYVENGSYFRLKNIQLGVRLPSTWTGKIHVNDFRVYIGATNLFTITKYSGMDPEVYLENPLVAGIDKASYPQARSITFGANITF